MSIQSDSISDLSFETEPACRTQFPHKRNTLKDDEQRIRIKKNVDHLFLWFEFLNKNKTKSLDYLPLEQLPKSSNKSEGYFIHVKSVTLWPVPKKLKRLITSNPDKQITFNISMTFYHVRSKRFFGNTWIGSEQPITSLGKCDSIAVHEIVYFRSKIVDPSCHCVIELVATEYSKGESTPTKLYGCGWALINPFANEEKHGNTIVHNGTLSSLLKMDHDEVESLFKLSSIQSKIEYDISKYKMLNRIQSKLHLFDYNQIVGANDIVPGLAKRHIEYPDGRGHIYENCLGAHTRDEKVPWCFDPPRRIFLCQILKLDITDLQIRFPKIMEHDMVFLNQINTTLSKKGSSNPEKKKFGMKRWVKSGMKYFINSSKSNSIYRSIKCAVHNGHTFLNSNSIELERDQSKDDILRAKSDTSVYYVKHPMCVLVMTLEYSIKLPNGHGKNIDIKKSLSSVHPGDMLSLSFGSVFYLPFDGKHLRLSRQAGESCSIQMSLENDEMHRVLVGKKSSHLYEAEDNFKTNDAVIYFNLSCRDSTNNLEQVDGTIETDCDQEKVPVPLLSLENPDFDKDDETDFKVKALHSDIQLKRDSHVSFIKSISPSDASEHTMDSLVKTNDDSKERPNINEAIKSENGENVINDLNTIPYDPQGCSSPSSLMELTFDCISLQKSKTATITEKMEPTGSHDKDATNDYVKKHNNVDAPKSFSTINDSSLHYDESFFQSTKFNEIDIYIDTYHMLEHCQPMPLSVYFSFSFYMFPEVKTELYHKNETLSSDSMIFFTNLKMVTKDGDDISRTTKKNIFSIDIYNMSSYEKKKYFEYMIHKDLIVDVWDGDSLLIIGTFKIPLHHLLRSTDDVFVQKEFDVKNNALLMSDKNSDITHDGIVKGKITVELKNSDRLPDTKNYTGISLSKPHDKGCLGDIQKARARPLLHTNGELMNLVQFLKKSLRNDTSISSSISPFPFSIQDENILPHNESRAKQLEAISIASDNRDSFGQSSFFDQRINFFRKLMDEYEGEHWDDFLELKVTEWFRQGLKQNFIKKHLNPPKASERIDVVAFFGQAVLVGVDFLNPYDKDETFRIDYTDRNLRLLFREDEIAYFQTNIERSNKSYPCGSILGSENICFDSDGRPQIAVRSKQITKVPFVLFFDNIDSLNRFLEDNVKQHTIDIRFIGKTFNDVCKCYKIVASLNLPIVHRTIYIASVQQGLLRKRVRFLGRNERGCNPENLPHFKCMANQPDHIFCEWDTNENKRPEILFLSIACCYEIQKEEKRHEAYIFLYNDDFYANIIECWRVIILPYLMISRKTIIGQEVSYDLDMYRDGTDKRVSLFSSDNDLKISPQTFQLNCKDRDTPKITQSIWREGTNQTIVHLVDQESKSLIHGWILQVDCSKPIISKEYDLKIQIGERTSKKLPLTNHWSEIKRYDILSSDERLVLPQPNGVEIQTSSTEHVRLAIHAPEQVGMYEVYLFLKDANRNEDCFLLKLWVKE